MCLQILSLILFNTLLLSYRITLHVLLFFVFLQYTLTINYFSLDLRRSWLCTAGV